MALLSVLVLALPLQSFRSTLEPYLQAARVCGAVVSAPDSAASWSALGEILHQRGRLDPARLALARATEIAPDDAPLALRLATVLRESGRHTEARRLLRDSETLPGWRRVGREHVMPSGRHQVGGGPSHTTSTGRLPHQLRWTPIPNETTPAARLLRPLRAFSTLRPRRTRRSTLRRTAASARRCRAPPTRRLPPAASTSGRLPSPPRPSAGG